LNILDLLYPGRKTPGVFVVLGQKCGSKSKNKIYFSKRPVLLHVCVQQTGLLRLRVKGREDMTKQTGTLRGRIRSGSVTRADVIRRLAELAFGDANDCVRLALEEGVSIRELDLSLLSEIRRNDKGTVEVRLIDRLKALEQLSQAAGKDTDGAQAFLQALQGEVEQQS
jgi:hypothetical protein